MSNIIYIATSLDGYIAKVDGGIDWLMEIPNPDQSDYGFADFMNRVDGVLMGRKTYEIVMNFEEWAYTKPVFVLTNSLEVLPGKWASKAEIIKGEPKDVIAALTNRGVNNLYVDGGKTIQSFLALDLIDEMIITKVPILLGDGIPLFSTSNLELKFEHLETDVYTGGLVKSRYLRKR
ncbi:MAG: dihydrofolate reductase family protein [Bacteroidota bacterium]